jgi:hypothetical protein
MAKEPAKSTQRAERLARALKANLGRRKAQKQARKDVAGSKDQGEPPEAD